MQVVRFSALRAAFLVPILLVISQPVRLCGAGRTVHSLERRTRGAELGSELFHYLDKYS